MFIKRFVLRTILVLSGIFGLINCSGGGGDPKPPTPPPPVTYVTTIDPREGTHSTPLSLQTEAGKSASFTLTLDSGYSNPVLTPMVGSIAPGVTTGTYVYTIASVNASSTSVLTATKDPTLYSISGKVTRGYGATITLSTGKSVTADANDNYIFTGVPTGNYIINISLYGWTFTPSFRNVGVNNADSTGNDFVATLVNPTVEMVINVFYKDTSGSGTTSCLVEGASIVPQTPGVYTWSLKKPGESSFVLLGSFNITPEIAGGFASVQLYGGDGFYDTLPDGTKKYWASGIATFKGEFTSLEGVKTSVIAKVGVLMGYVTFGPLQQATVSSDGKSINLVGSFPTAPVAKLYKFMPFPIRVSLTLVPDNFIVTIPAWFSSTDSRLTVVSGYPDAECSTVFVDISTH